MKRYSSPSGQGAQGQAAMMAIGCGVVVGVLALTSGSDNPIKQFQSQVFDDRVQALDAQRTAQNKIQLLNESAANARKIVEQYGIDGCEVIVNEKTEDIAAGRYHIGLSEGMVIRDPVTKNPFSAGFCVRDHLGNVAVLGPGGVADAVFYDPNLALTDFSTDTTQTLGGQ